MSTTKEIGTLGENIAVKLLEEKNFTILDRNWRFKHFELDIVAINNNSNTITFVEVKTRSANYIIEPELSITKKQQQFIIEAAKAYIDCHEYDLESSFDIVSIVLFKEKYTVKHISDAFFPYQK